MATRDPKQPVIIDLEDDDSVALVPWEYIVDKFTQILSPISAAIGAINTDIGRITETIRDLNAGGGGGGGGGGGVTPAQVRVMIQNSIDEDVSETSTNAIQNRSFKSYVDTNIPPLDTEMSDSSVNGVQNNTIKGYVDGLVGVINSRLEGEL